LLGPSGAGKSSFIADATGQDVKIGHLLTPCTDSIRAYETRRPEDTGSVVFIDTPGYDLADKSPNRVLNTLTQWLKAQGSGGKKVNLHAILFFHRIADNRMPNATQSHIRRFEDLVGKKGAPKRILLITTMWDEVDYQTGFARETQLKREFWKKFLEGGSRVCQFHRTRASAWDILNPIVCGTTAGVPLPPDLDSTIRGEPDTEPQIDADQALNVIEQIYHERQRLLDKLQVIVEGPDGAQSEALKEVLSEEKRISGKLGSLLNRLKRQNRRWCVSSLLQVIFSDPWIGSVPAGIQAEGNAV
ncbi:hypothetical protein P691DRAFT_677935, partial [Macrolepiota fuliginosa MF-IS2]